MKLIREHVQTKHGQSFASLTFDLPEFDPHYHYHPEIEITWILESEGQRLIGDHMAPFGPGDLVLIGSNVPHQYRNWKRGRALSRVVQFKLEILGEGLLKLPEFDRINSLLKRAARGVRFSSKTRRAGQEAMAKLFQTKHGAPSVIQLMDLLQRLSEDPSPTLLASPVYAEPIKLKKVERLQRVLNFLEKNWREQVTLDAVARVASLHPQSVSRFFRQHLGMTFQDYLGQLRISRAARLLIETDHTVVTVAHQCGFYNLANFNHQFRKIHGAAPSTFRLGGTGHGHNKP